MAQHDPVCLEKGIPAHLHQLGKSTVSFEAPELLYYRFRPVKIRDGKPGRSIFRMPNMSVLRESFCQSPRDVLYDGETGEHFLTWGVVALPFKEVEAIQFDEGAAREYKLKVVHDPLPCMYPHAEVQLFANGDKLDNIDDSAELKTWLRDALKDLCVIVVTPTPSGPH